MRRSSLGDEASWLLVAAACTALTALVLLHAAPALRALFTDFGSLERLSPVVRVALAPNTQWVLALHVAALSAGVTHRSLRPAVAVGSAGFVLALAMALLFATHGTLCAMEPIR